MTERQRSNSSKSLDELINEAAQAAAKKCGDCAAWMTHACPREKGVMKGGPSAGEIACDKFVEKKFRSVVPTKKEKKA